VVEQSLRTLASEQVRERERERALCGSLYMFYLYEYICFFKQACLLACSTYAQAMWYMPMHIAELIACMKNALGIGLCPG
jgi:hypothetical protein